MRYSVCMFLLSAQLAGAEPQRYALVVSVEQYLNPGFSHLSFAVDDGVALDAVLSAAGYQVTTLFDGEATKQRIEQEITRLRKQPQSSGDTVLICLAGHGVQPAGDPNAYYCPVDGLPQPDELATLVCLQSYIYPELAKSHARTKLLLVDACRNDPDTSRGITYDQKSAPPHGIAALFACSAGQRAWEDSEARHGVFFNHVLRKLRSASGQGVSMLTLAAEIAETVTADAQRIAGVPQSPGHAMIGDGNPLLLPKTGRPAGEVRSNIDLGMKLVWCPPDEFLLGSPARDENAQADEKPQNYVMLTRGFWIGRTEVTRAEWFKVMETRPWGEESEAERSTPASHITWNDALEFCKQLTKRERQANKLDGALRYTLPTEAQWEYACRAGSETLFHFGDSSDGTQSNVNGEFPTGVLRTGPFRGQLVAAGSYPPNKWGLVDMHGNVAEWCLDNYSTDAYQQRTDGITKDPVFQNGSADHALRGGGWSDDCADTRSARRRKMQGDRRLPFVGFRVILSDNPSVKSGA